jgi:preprotein translocase subunit SecD
MTFQRLSAFLILLVGIGLGFFIWSSQVGRFGSSFPFKFGLDISGGTHLVYKADTSKLPEGEIGQSIDALRDVIERRINLFGVAEPIVQSETRGAFSDNPEHRLIVELPGVTDIAKAVAMIGATPLLEFKSERPDGPEKEAIVAAIEKARKAGEGGQKIPDELLSDPLLNEDPNFIPTELTGAFLSRANLAFDQNTREPRVVLEFNEEGKRLFAEITKANVGKVIAIYLDGSPISTPVVREEITAGNAEITGSFTPEEGRELVGRLNSGALPVPIELLSTQTIGPALGAKALKSGVHAGILGILIVSCFLIVWYRLPGIVSVVALGVYVALMLTAFKLIPVTLTAAGIAGFILSIGMAVDANVLIFERLKEELRKGKDLASAMHDGFDRAWPSIRDSNTSSLISAVILFWFGTSLVKGFALTLGLGVIVSMFTAITASRFFLYAIGSKGKNPVVTFLFGTGLKP